MSYRIGADVGGTFTDIVVVSEENAELLIGKVLTTPERPDDAIIEGICKVLSENSIDPADVEHVVHGTTLFTNALIERKGAKTALVTTRGFRDAIEIGKEHRYDMYDLYMRRPDPLAPRYHRYEVDERILADGTIRKAIDPEEVRQLAQTLRDETIEAVAICLINSYVDASHEQQIVAILEAECPDLVITASSDLVPEIREYDRTSTTLANVYVKGIAERYLNRLKHRLADEAGIQGELFIMQSNGGVCEAEEAAKHPVLCVESGPAAGALAAAYYGAMVGSANLLSFDMGGTTAKASVIVDGDPLITSEFEVDRQYQFKKGSGLPVKVPVIEMIEIGTGGGSIARIDGMGSLRVGPQSAGSVPGPIAYDRGGEKPTITDADLLLGYLDPAFFLGGTMALNINGARHTIEQDIDAPLSLNGLQAAWGIHQIANEAMASAARIHAIERGKDVRRFPLFAFGGAGPVHAFGIARILRSPRVIYPLGAGVMSAVGFLTAPLSLQFVRSHPAKLQEINWHEVNDLLSDMETEGRTNLTSSVEADQISFQRYADIRYVKQGYEVRTAMPLGALSDKSASEIQTAFEETYRAIYGHIMNSDIEIVSWRVIAQGPKPSFHLPETSQNEVSCASEALKGNRAIYLPDEQKMIPVPVYDRYLLKAGMSFQGPAIIEEKESTVVINGKAEITVDAFSNLIVDLNAEEATS